MRKPVPLAVCRAIKLVPMILRGLKWAKNENIVKYYPGTKDRRHHAEREGPHYAERDAYLEELSCLGNILEFLSFAWNCGILIGRMRAEWHSLFQEQTELRWVNEAPLTV
jgi:hypothetical protein